MIVNILLCCDVCGHHWDAKPGMDVDDAGENPVHLDQALGTVMALCVGNNRRLHLCSPRCRESLVDALNERLLEELEPHVWALIKSARPKTDDDLEREAAEIYPPSSPPLGGTEEMPF